MYAQDVDCGCGLRRSGFGSKLLTNTAPTHQQKEGIGDGNLSYVLVRLSLSSALDGDRFFAEADIVNGPLESGSGALG
jgi:hypothetical protein